MGQREPVLVKDDIVVYRLARSKKSCVAGEIVIKHYWTDDCSTVVWTTISGR
jgi:hypothetical protein